MSVIECAVDECTTKVHSKGMCQKHYRRFNRNGNTDLQVTPEVSWDLIRDKSMNFNDCLIWQGSTDKDGYPRAYSPALYKSGSTNPLVYIRRWIMEQLGEELSSNIIESSCGDKLCVSKKHLQKSTVSEGLWTSAGINSRKEFCPRKHPLDAETKEGKRYCNTCTKGYQLQYLYGISLDEYNQMLIDQDNKCPGCLNTFGRMNGRWESGRTEVTVDHCHYSGVIRALLCHHCNTTLGFARDNKHTLKRLIKYLEDNEIN